MNKNKEILIIGAGPSGLSLAIFLNELGYNPRVIDKKEKISAYSKALGVNPRTLELLESSGITSKFLDNGYKMHAINIWKGDKHIIKNDFRKVNHKYPFMLIQPQKDSEEILLEEALKRNINVEYNTEFKSIKKDNNQHSAIINSNSTEYEIAYDYLIGADGGQSNVRKLSGVRYDGLRYDEEWELYDVEIDMDIDGNEGHVRFFPEGSVLMIRLYDNVWRVAGRMNSILNYMPKNSKIGNILWESKFRIHHKIAQKLTWDNIGIIGDAAHLHSPVGARGMNLGIEDAYVLSELIHNNRFKEFDAVRRPYIEKTVSGINSLTMVLAGDNQRSRLLRKNIQVLKIVAPFVMPKAKKFVLGIN
ncbi:FAD-dependent monooxygenase [Aquimarina sp. MMG016]|uniref:FAD-dependent oxidoreductase n=1 Tax=Aquimarina sp. MMG016 TaxID=2822690 RepID=UPI001B3A3144|nr:FAD-dependent monooxygenase [Aquimarina sp. MMG016]MBQ4820272.1 FAD-dependent monooxygenase [Aquimarina sp. MMG016]